MYLNFKGEFDLGMSKKTKKSIKSRKPEKNNRKNRIEKKNRSNQLKLKKKPADSVRFYK
jgi:hypothetical protein